MCIKYAIDFIHLSFGPHELVTAISYFLIFTIMPLKKIYSALFLFCLFHSLHAQETATTSITLSKVRLDFKLDAKGAPVYAVYFNQQPVIQSSKMGFILIEDSLMDRGFELLGSETKKADETWK